MKRLVAVVVAVGLLAGAPGLPAHRAFAQVVTGAVGAPAPVAGAAGAAAVTRVGTVPGAMLPPAGLSLGPALPSAGLPSPAALTQGPAGVARPAAVSPSASMQGLAPAGGLTGGAARPQAGAAPSALAASPSSLALALPAIASPGSTASALEGRDGPRGPPSAGVLARSLARGLAAPKVAEGSEAHTLGLLSREGARFDGSGARAEGPALRPDAPPVSAARNVLYGPSASALPEGGALFPPAPGLQAKGGSAAPAPAAPEQAGYRLPASLRWPARIYMAAHALALTSAVVILFSALGAGMVVSTALVGGAIASQWKVLRNYSPDPQLKFDEPQRRAVEEYAGGILDGLLARVGLSAARRPRVEVTNARGAENAYVEGKSIGPEAKVNVGEGVYFLPRAHAEGMLAHELGHLAHRDLTLGRYVRQKAAMELARELFPRLVGWAAAVDLLPFVWRWIQSGFDSTILAHPASVAAAACAAAILLGTVGFLFGLAALRQQELRADHWAAWATGGFGWLKYLETAWARVSHAPRGLWPKLTSEHPELSERIRRLKQPGFSRLLHGRMKDPG